MWNLVLSRSTHVHDSGLLETRDITIDPETDTLYAVNAAGNLLIPGVGTIHGFHPADPESKQSPVVGIDFIIERQLICIVRLSGEVHTYDPNSGISAVAIASCEAARCAAWSPQQDILLIAFGDESIVAYTQFFDRLARVDLNPAGTGSAESVNVGWGSKETQFHGSEGKSAAKTKQQVI